MAGICQSVINAMKPDLVFTTKVREDFGDNKLPTLDFKTLPIGDLEAQTPGNFGGENAKKMKDY